MTSFRYVGPAPAFAHAAGIGKLRNYHFFTVKNVPAISAVFRYHHYQHPSQKSLFYPTQMSGFLCLLVRRNLYPPAANSVAIDIHQEVSGVSEDIIE